MDRGRGRRRASRPRGLNLARHDLKLELLGASFELLGVPIELLGASIELLGAALELLGAPP